MPRKGGLRSQLLLCWMASLTVFRDKIILLPRDSREVAQEAPSYARAWTPVLTVTVLAIAAGRFASARKHYRAVEGPGGLATTPATTPAEGPVASAATRP
jgi:hypothetical protein